MTADKEEMTAEERLALARLKDILKATEVEEEVEES